MRSVQNARIGSTFLGFHNGCIFNCWLHLEFDGSGQGFGGYAFDQFDKARNKRVGSAYGCEFIRRLIETVGVESWEELPGRHVRVDHDHGKVYGIGHIVKDVWFLPDRDLPDLLPDAKAEPDS